MPRTDRRAYLAMLAVLVVLATVPLWASNLYVLHTVIRVSLAAVLAIGLTLIYRMGYLSFGHAAYVGLGAYTSVLLVTKLAWSFWAAFLTAGLVTALVALLIGRITLGLSGIYFSITTFAFTEVLRGVYIAFPRTFGGPGGIMSIPFPDGIRTDVQYYYFVVIFLALNFFVFYRLGGSSFGLLCDGLRLSSLAEEHVGLNTRHLKTCVFVIAATAAGLTGSVLAHYLGQITPDVFGVGLSTDILVYCVVGGLGSVPGTAIGAAVLSFVGELLYGLGAYKMLVFGSILIAIILFVPGGLASLGSWSPGRSGSRKRKAARLGCA
jgi:branched-chain amino acid transport system permease protein